MDDIDMIFLFQQHLEGIDLSWLEGIDKRVREEKEKEDKDNATSNNNN